MRIRVLDPTVDTVPLTSKAAATFTSLRGLTIGLLDNGKVNVRPLLDSMADILRTQHGVKTVLRFKKPDASRPAPPDVLESMAGCDAMISAVGD